MLVKTKAVPNKYSQTLGTHGHL